MNLTVLGATGGIGRHVVSQALDAGHHVTAYDRSPAKLNLTHATLPVIAGELSDRDRPPRAHWLTPGMSERVAAARLARRRRDRHQSGRSSPSSSSPS